MSESLRLRSLLAASVSVAAMLGVAAPAFAQDTTIGEIVVTAQKKEEALQDVPIAVSAFSQQALEAAKIDGGPNLVLAVPNVSFSKTNFTGYNFQIRGIGSKLTAASGDAGTGIHLNNAPLTANNLFEAEFFDVERVEVLRGPQGTLYGRNATGGVVNLISAKPIDGFEASVRAEVGNFNSRKLRGMVNIPLGDMFALRVAGAMLQRDGFSDNLRTGHDVDGRDLWNTRATLAFEPSDSFHATLMWDHFEEDDNRSRVGRYLCTTDPGPTAIDGSAFNADPTLAALQRGFFTQGCSATPVDDANINGVTHSSATLSGLYGNLFGMTSGNSNAGMTQNRDIRTIDSVEDPIYRAETDIVQFDVSIDLTDSLRLTALTGYSKNSLFTRQDFTRTTSTGTFNVTPGPNLYDGALPPGLYNLLYTTAFPGGYVADPQLGTYNTTVAMDISGGESTSWSQELRVQSDFDGPLNFNVGAIYIDFESSGDYYVMANTLTSVVQLHNLAPVAIGASLNIPCYSGSPCYVDPNPDPNRSGHNYYDNTGGYHLKSRAVFGELYWQIAENFKITGGLRYTHDMKRSENRPTRLFKDGPAGIPLLASDPWETAEFEEMTGRLGFDWKPDVSFTDDTLVYLFYSRGYKGGGMNPQCSADICPPATFDPEFVNAWELGAKNTLMGGAMVMNLTAFHYDYIGYQVSKIVNRSAVNENIDAKIKGLELESIWSPMDGLRLNLNVGYLNTEIANGSESVDVMNRTGGDPLLTLVKSSTASNCVVSTASAAFAVNYSNFLGNAFVPLYLCSANTNPIIAAMGAGTPIVPGGPLAVGTNGLGSLYSDGVVSDLGGNELPNSPHYTVSFGAQYSWSMGGWDATMRGDYYRQTSSFTRIYNANTDALDGWDNINATFMLKNSDMGLNLELYVKNLTDEEALVDVYTSDDSTGLARNGFYGEPRTYGLSVTKSF